MKLNKLNSVFLLFLASILLFSCEPEKEKNNGIKTKAAAKITSPEHDTQYTIGDVLTIEIEVFNEAEVNDLSLFINDTLYKSNLESKTQSVAIPTSKGKVGFTSVYITYNDSKGKPHRDTRNIIFFSDITPEMKFATIVKEHPHNISSYTQGLEFYKGVLYESTGQNGSSIIAEVNLETGNHIRFVDLDAKHFGEGITILNDTIYQITWETHTCVVYDMNFNKIKEYSFDGEGWGLTNNGKSIIMSNGSSEIVWRNPQTFKIEKSIYVFEPNKDITQLNELELINDKLYANVYGENKVVEVDTTTGKVLAYIDCAELSNKGRGVGGNVLNGIAYNKETGKVYMTGKLWHKLFEVKFE